MGRIVKIIKGPPPSPREPVDSPVSRCTDKNHPRFPTSVGACGPPLASRQPETLSVNPEDIPCPQGMECDECFEAFADWVMFKNRTGQFDKLSAMTLLRINEDCRAQARYWFEIIDNLKAAIRVMFQNLIYVHNGEQRSFHLEITAHQCEIERIEIEEVHSRIRVRRQLAVEQAFSQQLPQQLALPRQAPVPAMRCDITENSTRRSRGTRFTGMFKTRPTPSAEPAPLQQPSHHAVPARPLDLTGNTTFRSRGTRFSRGTKTQQTSPALKEPLPQVQPKQPTRPRTPPPAVEMLPAKRRPEPVDGHKKLVDPFIGLSEKEKLEDLGSDFSWAMRECDYERAQGTVRDDKPLAEPSPEVAAALDQAMKDAESVSFWRRCMQATRYTRPSLHDMCKTAYDAAWAKIGGDLDAPREPRSKAVPRAKLLAMDLDTDYLEGAMEVRREDRDRQLSPTPGAPGRQAWLEDITATVSTVAAKAWDFTRRLFF